MKQTMLQSRATLDWQERQVIQVSLYRMAMLHWQQNVVSLVRFYWEVASQIHYSQVLMIRKVVRHRVVKVQVLRQEKKVDRHHLQVSRQV